jgi:putative ABC transport system ATP-binding protein
MSTEVLVELVNVQKTYGTGENEVHALRNASLKVRAGELVAIMGSSGSGKSTLLTIAGGLEVPTSGDVRIVNESVPGLKQKDLARLRRQTIGYVFQDFNLIPSLTVVENVALPLELDGMKSRNARRAALDSLASMGIEELAKRFPDEISGGQRQRVAIARSFVGPRRVLLADEPTGALDSKTSESVIRAMRKRIDGGLAGILVTHDAKLAAWADRILVIRDGQIIDELNSEIRPEHFGAI